MTPYHEGVKRVPVEVQIPSLLRKATGGEKQLQIDGGTVAKVMENLTAKYPALKDSLLTPEGKVQSFVVLCLNNEDTRFLQGTNTLTTDGDVVSILLAVGGGSTAYCGEE